ncbi:MAG TPA: GNAT family N-acetyltransferase [Candidatus Acidoferrales bacterium]|nr:GNAT family N-acetyltransferase [Candidatus Acidoferrales bacterium]
MATSQPQTEIVIRPLHESDLPAADRIIRVAFGTFLGMPDPTAFMGDASMARTRWLADHGSVLVAEHNGKVIGSNFATNWGSFGFFGPLTVEPEYWNRGVAQRLLGPTMEIFRRWGNRHLGLYTFPHSPKHMALYQKFGFWPRDLVVNFAKTVDGAPAVPLDVSRFSEAKLADRESLIAACREITDAIFEGLDVQREIRAVAEQNLGDTILIWDSSRLAGFAVCHTGAGTEAGSGVCYAKFAAVRPGPRSEETFARLLRGIESFAASRRAPKVTADVNAARREAFRAMLANGFRPERQGVAMETGNASSGYNRAGVYILDDWR